jgi:RNA recognition motif-containing protein
VTFVSEETAKVCLGPAVQKGASAAAGIGTNNSEDKYAEVACKVSVDADAVADKDTEASSTTTGSSEVEKEISGPESHMYQYWYERIRPTLGHTIDVKVALPRNTRKRTHPLKVFVGGLQSDVTNEVLVEHFSSTFGKVASVEIIYNRVNHSPRGFGFVIFTDEQGYDACLAQRQQQILGHTVEVKAAIARDDMPKGAKRFGRNRHNHNHDRHAAIYHQNPILGFGTNGEYMPMPSSGFLPPQQYALYPRTAYPREPELVHLMQQMHFGSQHHLPAHAFGTPFPLPYVQQGAQQLQQAQGHVHGSHGIPLVTAAPGMMPNNFHSHVQAHTNSQSLMQGPNGGSSSKSNGSSGMISVMQVQVPVPVPVPYMLMPPGTQAASEPMTNLAHPNGEMIPTAMPPPVARAEEGETNKTFPVDSSSDERFNNV